MKIAVDIRPLQNESGGRGVGRYVRELIARLPADGDTTLYLESRWGRSPALPAGASGSRVRLLRPARAITVFDQVASPWLCVRLGIDVFHSTFYALPLFVSSRTRLVLTVHDLIPLVIEGSAGRKNTAIFRRIYESARAADVVIVPSRRTRDDLVRFMAIRQERIRVIPMAVGRPFALIEKEGAAGATAVEKARASFRPFQPMREAGAAVLIYAGGFNTNKNVLFLIDALREMGDPAGGGAPPVLCVVGDPGDARVTLLQAARRAGVDGRLVFLGRLSDEDLAAAYRAADVFVSASRYEGFGLPALEAMASGCPVVALSTAAVPEVLEDASLEIEEEDPSEFAVAVERVLRGAGLRADLVVKGRARAAALTWERTARETHALYHEIEGLAASEDGRA
jgi:glycosyltransferase involved in cell wall biosynthesis